MGLSDLFKNIFGLSVAIPADERALSGASEDALATSLEKLANRADGFRRGSGRPLLDGTSAVRVR
jgi:hypothetical protein